MAHWFHRNPLKNTGKISFDQYRSSSTTPAASKLLGEMKESRAKLLNLVRNPESSLADVTTLMNEYAANARGLVQGSAEGAGKESGPRYVVLYRWTNTMQGKKVSEQLDAQFELYSMLFDVAVWHTKHAAHLASNPEISMNDAKEVHRTLRAAAGIFETLKDSELPKLHDTGDKGADTDTRILDAYVMQCQAEAQEITLARAVELKHKNSLISALSSETSKMFMTAGDHLSTLDQLQVGKWKKYSGIKEAFYKSYAYCYLGLSLLEEDKCGNAIRCLRESLKAFGMAEQLCREYATMKGPGSHARPQDHMFFRKLSPLVKGTLEKCEHENGFIYFQKVPDEVPELPMKATFGLASAEPYSMPPVNPEWTEEALKSLKAAQDGAEKLNLQSGSKSAVAEDITPIPEPNISSEPAPPPKTNSGCIVQ